MSNVVFTPVPGLSWSVFKTPQLQTIVQTAASGKTTRAQLWSNPVWTFKLTWEGIKDLNATPSDIQTLIDFFLARGGSFDTFLYSDPSDNSVTGQNFGTGDGVTVAFQLVRSLAGNFNESIQNLDGPAVIKDNGVTKVAGTDYSINTTGVVTFAVAPVAAHALTWTGNFFYRLRFKNDLQDFEQFMKTFWTVKTLELISEKL